MNEKRKKNRYFKYLTVVLLVVFIVAASLFVMNLWERGQGLFPEPDPSDQPFVYEGKEYRLKENIETFLVLGLDKYEKDESVLDSYNNDKQADFLMLFVFDNNAKTFSAIHVNRDTMTKVNVLGVAGNKIDSVTKQIALAHTHGNGKDVSCRNTADAVSDLLLGRKVNHYLSLTMDSVPILNDAVGGVEVTVLDDFTGIDDGLVKGQTVTLRGEQALHYVRTRYGLEDSTNSTRMERQRQYVNALHAKFEQCVAQDPDFIVNTSLSVSEYLVSDRSVTQLQELVRKFNEYEFTGIRSMEGESRLGAEFIEFYPKESSIKKIVAELFYTPKD
ncbi:MAG: LCP family protein [Clostridia bacterium]|nr:LCP family protein [Clostridia bacterium]